MTKVTTWRPWTRAELDRCSDPIRFLARDHGRMPCTTWRFGWDETRSADHHDETGRERRRVAPPEQGPRQLDILGVDTGTDLSSAWHKNALLRRNP